MKKLEYLPKFIHTCMTIGEIPTSYKLSLTCEEQLMWFCKFLQEEVIPVVNNNSEAVQELQTYVANFFDNLDVTEEVSDKLDQMAEDGTLEAIMVEYLNVKAILCFSSVANMKSATNVIEGSFLQTYGFYNIGDGGNAKYYVRQITNEDTVDDITIVGLTNFPTLIAELIIENEINVKQFGCKGDNTTNDGANLQKAFSFANTLHKNIYFPQGQYLTQSKLYISSDLQINGGNSEIISSTLDETFVVQTNAKVTVKDIKITTNSGIAFHINNTNVDNVILDNVTINSEGYGFLLNYNTANGSNLKIVNSNITGKADGIELNLTNESDIFNTIIISNNVIKSKSTGTGTSSGFAIGISKGKRVIIDGNIIPYSRLEAIHCEAGCEETIITNNILHECDGEGIRLLPLNTITRQTPRISNNLIKGKDKSDYGIRCVNDTNGYFNEIDITNNLIENFNIGITTETGGIKYLNVDNTIIKDCNVAISGNPRKILGKLNLINTPKLINGTSTYSLINFDEIITDNLTDDFISSSNSAKVFIKNLQAIKSGTANKPSGGDVLTVPIMKLPTYFKGTIKVFNNYAATIIGNLVADVEIKNGELTSTNEIVGHYGNISSSQLSLDDNGYLCYKCYAPGISNGATVPLQVEFEGTLCFINYNNT